MRELIISLVVGLLMMACTNSSSVLPQPENELPQQGVLRGKAEVVEESDGYRINWLTITTWEDSHEQGRVFDLKSEMILPRHSMVIRQLDNITLLELKGVPFSSSSVSYDIYQSDRTINLTLEGIDFVKEKDPISTKEVVIGILHDFSIELPELEKSIYRVNLTYDDRTNAIFSETQEDREIQTLSFDANLTGGFCEYLLPFGDYEYRPPFAWYGYPENSIYGLMGYHIWQRNSSEWIKLGTYMDYSEPCPEGFSHKIDFTLSNDTLSCEILGWEDYGARPMCCWISNDFSPEDCIDIMMQYQEDNSDIVHPGYWYHDFEIRIPEVKEGQKKFKLRSLLDQNRIWECDVNLVEGETVTVHFDTHDPSSGTTSGIYPIYY